MIRYYLLFAVLIGIINNSQQYRRRHHNYQSGLIFYDLKTNETLLPPIVSSEKFARPQFRLPNFGMPCSCHTLNCGCCAGMNFQQFNNQCE